MLVNNKITMILVTITCFLWGSNYHAVSIVLGHVAPLVGVSMRFIIATVAIFIFMYIKEGIGLSVLKNNWLAFMLLGLSGVAGFNLAFFFGLQTTSPINGALIMATSPVVSTLIAMIIDKYKLSLAQTVGMLISFIGVVLVISNGSLSNILNFHFNQGDLIMMGGNILWGIYTVGSRKYIHNSTPLKTTSYTMLFGSLGIFAVALCAQDNLMTAFQSIGTFDFSIIIYMAIFGTVLSYLFWVMGISVLGAARTSIFFNLVPVFTMLLSIYFGSYPNLLQIVGTLLVITGVIYSTTSIHQHLFEKRTDTVSE